MTLRPNRNIALAKGQRGVVLIIALVVLVAMTLAAIALTRSVDIATQISGNLAYRQSGIQAADGAVEVARDWLMRRSMTDLVSLQGDISPSYYATSTGGAAGTPAIFDPITFNWAGKTETSTDVAGNKAAYVIHRMCELPGDPASGGTNCFTAPVVVSGKTNAINAQAAPDTLSSNPYYRITVRVTGPKDTVTYTQVVLY